MFLTQSKPQSVSGKPGHIFILLFSSSRRCSSGFRSGLHAGHSKHRMETFSKYLKTVVAECGITCA